MAIFRRWDAVQFSWMDTGEVGWLLLNGAIIARKSSKCYLTGDIWDKARRTGLATKTG